MPTVLVTDDQADIRMLLVAMLGARGHEVIEAANGTEAIEAIRTRDDIDAVLLDVKMPGLDGFEVLQTIRADGHDVPVVMMSAHVARDARFASERNNAQGFIEKPFDTNSLLRTLEAVTES